MTKSSTTKALKDFKETLKEWKSNPPPYEQWILDSYEESLRSIILDLKEELEELKELKELKEGEE